jgi:predicted ArsR family transcriptional regulator
VQVTDIERDIERLCLLDDPARRRVYLAVRRAAEPPTRADVAREAGISVELAAFHLEKLAEHGWLELSEDRPQRPRRAGRPAKRYRPVSVDLEVTIPPRRHDLAASILAAVVAEGASASVAERIGEVARRRGADLAGVHPAAGRRGGALALLADLGYEPREQGGRVVLRNCPFQRAAEEAPGVVCAMNSAFVRGVLDAARAHTHVPVFDRQPGRCCVVLESRPGASTGPGEPPRTPERRRTTR